MKFVFCFFACLTIGSVSKAQVTIPESPIKQAADQLVAATTAGYYAKLLFSNLAASVDPCAKNLCNQSALPVTLISFTGFRIDNTNVSLSWETSQEFNNDHFEVERTRNPRLGYQTVKLVKGAGLSASSVKYQITDPNDDTGYTYYRLKQVDFDGSNNYSSVIAIKAALAPFTITAFPNPGQGKNIVFKMTGVNVSEQLIIIIYDVNGRIVYQNNNYLVPPEELIFKTNLLHLSFGKYNIKMKSRDRNAIGSFVLIP